MKLAWILIAIAALCIVMLAVLRGRRPDAPATPAARDTAAGVGSPIDAAGGLESDSLPAPRSNVAPNAPGSLPHAQTITDDALLELLRSIAQAQAAADVIALKRDLEAVIIDVSTPLRVLELMKAGLLAQDVVVSRGGMLVLSVAIKRYNAGDGFQGIDGRAFLMAVLDALPEIKPPEQGQLIDAISRARVNDRYVLDLSYLSKILDLRRRYPDQAKVFSALLAHIAEELAGGPEFEQFYSLFVNDTSDPMAVRVSLSALLRTKGNVFLPMAEEMFARAKGDLAMQHAITQAIATFAPVDDAVKSMSRLADSQLAAEFDVLGNRPGALEALGAQYSDLVATDSSPTARMMLVLGMQNDKEQVMLGIAATDPDPLVRAQALLNLTFKQDISDRALDALFQAYDNRADPNVGIASNLAIGAAGNVLTNASGSQRERAQRFLMQIAYDTSLPDEERLTAVAKLRPRVPKGTLKGLVIGGQLVE